MSKTNFDEKKDIIEAIAENDVMYPNMPVSIALQESEDLKEWCQPDKELLEKAGLDWALVTDLPARTGACRYIQSQWQKDYQSLEQDQKEWREKSPVAYNLRDELLHDFFHAYHNFPELLGRVQKIAEGNSHADMIQDLSDLAALGKANTSQLSAINTDLTKLDQAELMAEQMAALLARSNGKKLENNKLRLLRDKTFTYMKQAVDEIRRHGQYVFWKNELRNKGYISRYHKKKAGKPTEAEKAKS